MPACVDLNQLCPAADSVNAEDCALSDLPDNFQFVTFACGCCGKFNVQIGDETQILTSDELYQKMIINFGKDKATKIMFACEIYGTHEISTELVKIVIKKIID